MQWRLWRTLDGYPVVGSDFIPLPTAAVRVYSAYYRVRYGHDLSDPFAWPLVETDIPDPSKVFAPDGRILDSALAAKYRLAVLSALGGEKGKGLLDWPDVLQWMKAHHHRTMTIEFGMHVRQQRAELLKWLHNALADGALYSVAHMPSSGALVGLKPEAWRCDHRIALMRFESCRFNWADKFETRPRKYLREGSSYGYLFIPRDHVEMATAVFDGTYSPSAKALPAEVIPVKQEAEAAPEPPKQAAQTGMTRRAPARKGGRPKPGWYPELQKLMRQERDRADRAREFGREPPIRLTNKMLADAINKINPSYRVRIDGIQRHREAAERSLDED